MFFLNYKVLTPIFNHIFRHWLIDCLLLNVQWQIFHAYSERSSTIINIEKVVGWDTKGKRFLTAIIKREWWVWTKNLAFCSGLHLFFSEFTKAVFYVQGAWHTPNTSPTMFHGQTFRIISWQPHNERSSPICNLGWRWVSSVGRALETAPLPTILKHKRKKSIFIFEIS